MPTLIVKPTERCTSNCAYCDVVTKEKKFDDMTEDTLHLLFERADEYLKANPVQQLTWIWHGGEPLLMGRTFYRHATELLHSICAETKNRIHFAMQSNLMLLDDEWCGILKQMGLNSLGSSYDPIDGARGPGEPCDTAAYNRTFLRGKSVAKQNGISVGIIYVLTKPALLRPMEVFHHLVNLTDGGFNIHPVLLYHGRCPELAITPDEYADFLGEIFPEWWNNQGRYGEINPFSSLVKNIIEQQPSLGCCNSGSCAREHISIAPDGHISHCGRSEDWNLLDYGMIQDRKLNEVLADSKRTELEERNRFLTENECKGCRFWNICHGGCPLDGWAESGGLQRRSPWGCAQKLFITRHFEPITGVRYES